MKKYLTLTFIASLFAIIAPASISSAQQRQIPPTLDQLRAEKFVVQTLQGKRIDLNKLITSGDRLLGDVVRSMSTRDPASA
jgi:hypothetical protein